jgi:hypothetical protein
MVMIKTLRTRFALVLAIRFFSPHSVLLYELETRASAIRFTSNPTRIALGSNCGLSVEKPATNRLSYGKTFVWFLHKIRDPNNE